MIDTVQVALRIRPLMKGETDRGCDNCINVVPGEPQVQIKDLSFTFNYVFAPHITQQEFYDKAVKSLIGQLFKGYNVTILAYGQTGSGKTFTMGTNYSGSDGDTTKLGVIPQAVADIFEYMEHHKDEFTFKVSVSFMELYQEQCYDLLSGKERAHSIIEIREDHNKEVILPGMTELPVSTTTETMCVLERGSAGRVTGSTAMNQASSRSHAVFTIVIAKESRTDKNIATTSKFHLVDLAGSERIKKTMAIGERLKEGVKINQGLLALGNVISALGDGTNRSFIGYRDSKLTRLLQDSLGGNSLTLMVACVSPADYNLDETVSTLRYADRARRIRNKPIINQDAKAAEILRLNNLINELRLELVGKAPCSSHSKEFDEEELEKEQAKYEELLRKHKLLTENLNYLLAENTNLCERAIIAEISGDKIESKLNELLQFTNEAIDDLNNNGEKEGIDYIKEIKSKLVELQSFRMKSNAELIDHEIKLSFAETSVEKSDDDSVVLSDDQTRLEEEKRTMGQMALNQELQELNRAMAIKASVKQAIEDNNMEMLERQNCLQENQKKVMSLEKERDELLKQLKLSNKHKDPTHEERRSKVSTLESEISELKKKNQQLANIIKTKEKNEAKIASLNAELQSMKATKVKIIRQLREESEKYRKWKADNERAFLRLKNEDRKRAAAVVKMEALYNKQQTVLKRKMEEAVAVNKRLKEALDRQKQTKVRRSAKGNLKTAAIQQYIEQELELHLSIVDAERSLDELMEYRALLIEKLERLRNMTDEESRKEQEVEMENLALRKAQISDLQQKILSADLENKAHTQWDNIQSMLEAKVALKCLFDMLIDAKRELYNQSEKIYQARFEEIKESHDRLKVELESVKLEHRKQLSTLKAQNDKKLAELLAIQRGVVKNGEEGTPCHGLQTVIQNLEEQIASITAENKRLTEELESIRSTGEKKKKSNKSYEKGSKDVVYIDLAEDEDDDYDEDHANDPDWLSTPLMKQIKAQRSRLTMNFTQTEDHRKDKSVSVKRSNDGAVHCSCRGSCATKICGCVKATQSCSTKCRCQHESCKNRLSDENDKENQRLSDQPSVSYKDDDPNKTFVKKNRFFFFDPRNQDTNKGE